MNTILIRKTNNQHVINTAHHILTTSDRDHRVGGACCEMVKTDETLGGFTNFIRCNTTCKGCFTRHLALTCPSTFIGWE